MKKNYLFNRKTLFTLGLATAVLLGGCGNASTEKADNGTSGETTTSETSGDTSSEVTSDTSSEASSEESNNTSSEASGETSSGETESTSSETGDLDSTAIFEKFCSDELELDGKLFSERYSESIEEFGEAKHYFYDVDEDSQDEMLVVNYYYGYEILDVRNGELKVLDGGYDTTDNCFIYENGEHIYVGHVDTLHMDRDVMTLKRYDETGNVIDTVNFKAEFKDSDTYDKNSTFYINDEKVNMKKYEKELNKFKVVDF